MQGVSDARALEGSEVAFRTFGAAGSQGGDRGHSEGLWDGSASPYPPPHARVRPLLSGWLILYRGGWGGGSEAKKKFVYLKSTSKFGPL